MSGIKIYRGTSQIGGIVTEIMKEDHRLLIDFGANLPGTENAKISDDALVDMVFGKNSGACTTDAVLFTHYHGDHVGLKNRIPDDVPLYVGRTAKEIMKVIAGRVDYMKKETGRADEIEMPVINRMEPYWKLGTARDFHGIQVTPLVCDHSALDAHMFVIELNGKKILYTGDFRDHGIPGEKTFESMIRTHVGKVDILVTEGTMVSREDETNHNPIKTETQLGKRAREIFEAHKENVVLVSSTNLDSIMEFYHATPKGKAFLCDPYQAELMKIAIEARHKYFPQKYYFGKEIYVLCPGEDKKYMLALKDYKDPDRDRCPFDLAKPEKYLDMGFVMLARPNRNPKEKTGRFEDRMKAMKDPFITYSMWTGYLENGKAPDPAVVNFMKDYNDKEHMEVLHTSGHAYVETLKKLMDMTDPETIIPMHTEDAKAFENVEAFSRYRERIHTIRDGEVFEIG